MSKHLEEIFNQCIERLEQGDSIENCLMNYPEVAADLEILLRTAVNIHWRASMVQPRPEFKAYARARFTGAQYAATQERQPSQRPTIFSLQRAWVPALAMVLLLVFSSVGTAAAASNAMPDEPLYPVKLATEQVRLTMTISNESKAELNVQLVETRSQEIATMATQGKPEQVAVATDRLVQYLEAAEQAIVKVEETKIKQSTPAPQVVPVSPPQPVLPPPPPPQPSTTPTPPPVTTPTPLPTTDKSRSAIDTEQAGAPSTSSKEKVTSTGAAKLRETLKTTISKNVTTLENARDKTPERTKEALQKAIDLAKARQLQLQQPGKGITTKPTSTLPTSGNTTKPSQTPPTTIPITIPPKPPTQQDTKQPQSTTGGTTMLVNPVPGTPKETTGNWTGVGDTNKSSSSSTVTNHHNE